MARKRKNVGLYISENDIEISKWINHLKREKENPAKWISGLIINEKNGETPLRLTISSSSPSNYNGKTSANHLNNSSNHTMSMFGSGSSINQKSVLQNEKWKYGWQVKDENGEFTIGSVINLSFCRAEVVDILLELEKSGIKLATYVKALISKCLEAGEDCPELTADKLEVLLRDYYIQAANNQLETKAS